MTTPASPLSVQDFASRIRAKYPGSYDSIPDDELAKRIVAKHPEYQNKVSFGAAPAAQTGGASQGTSAASGATPQSMKFGSYDPLNPTFLEKIGAGMGLGPDQIAKAEDIWGRFAGGAGLPQQMSSDQGFGANVKQGAKQMFAPDASKEHPGFGQELPILGTAFRQQRETYDQPGAWAKIYGSIPFVGPPAYQMGKNLDRGDYAGALGSGANIITQFLGGRAAPEAAAGIPATAETAIRTVRELRPGLDEASHTILGNAATKVKQTVGQGGAIHNAVSEHFNKLSNDIIAADYASGKKISTEDLWENLTKYGDDYAAGKTTPKFNAIAQELQNRPVELTWKELHDVQMNVDKAAAGAAEGSRDAGAANQMRADIARKLDEKAAEVGRGEQWDAAKTIWRTMKEYQGDGVLKKLLGTGTDPVAVGGVAEGGKQFFDILRDRANQAKLKEINQNLKPYGLPDNYFANIAKNHAPLHDYVSILGEPKSRVKLMMKHPFSAAPGVIAGGAAGMATGVPMGGFIGGTIGGTATAVGAARMKAAGAVERLGGRPEAVTPMADAAKVQPIGTGEKPTPPAAAPGAVNFRDLVSVLVDQGYSKADAQRFAMRGVEQYPNDFSKAFNVAVRGDRPQPVSGGSQASERGTYSRDERTQKQMLEDIRALKEGGRTLRKDK